MVIIHEKELESINEKPWKWVMRCWNSSKNDQCEAKMLGRLQQEPQSVQCSGQSQEGLPEKEVTNMVRGNKMVRRFKSTIKHGNITRSSAYGPQRWAPVDVGRRDPSFPVGRDGVELFHAPRASLQGWQMSCVVHIMLLSLPLGRAVSAAGEERTHMQGKLLPSWLSLSEEKTNICEVAQDR